jgi:plastocyanin
VGLRIAAAAVLVALAATAGSARADNPVLTGTVGTGDDFVLTLTGADGQVVKHLDPGTYTIVVHDQSTFHNFHFFGPGGAFTTTVNGTGDQTFTLNLTDGTYTYQCDPHAASGMLQRFTVGTPPTTAPPPSPLPSPPVKLTGSVTGARASLSGVAGLSAGKATITIADRSKTDGFLLQGPGVSKKTGIAFTGRVTWKVTLRAGKYVFAPVRHPKARRTFSVSPA